MTGSAPGAGSDNPTMATSGRCRRTTSTAQRPSVVWPTTRTAPPETRSSSSSNPRENSRSRSMRTTVTAVIASSESGGGGAGRSRSVTGPQFPGSLDLLHELEEDPGHRAVGRVEELAAGEAADAPLAEDRLVVGEGVEALLGVVDAHPARADPAEGHVVLHVVHEGVVDRHAARRRLLQHPLLRLPLVGEDVEGQR